MQPSSASTSSPRAGRPGPDGGAISAADAWAAVERGEARILDLRTALERRKHGWPPGSRRVSLIRHVMRPKGPGTIYLCQHANRSKLTRRRGAPEIVDGWRGWEEASLPIERTGRGD